MEIVIIGGIKAARAGKLLDQNFDDGDDFSEASKRKSTILNC